MRPLGLETLRRRPQVRTRSPWSTPTVTTITGLLQTGTTSIRVKDRHKEDNKVRDSGGPDQGRGDLSVTPCVAGKYFDERKTGARQTDRDAGYAAERSGPGVWVSGQKEKRYPEGNHRPSGDYSVLKRDAGESM